MYTNYARFYKSNFTWMMSKFNNVIELANLPALPNESFLHTLDNFNNNEVPLIVPDVSNPLLVKAQGFKYLYHVTEPLELTDPLYEIPTRGIILIKSGVSKQLLDFKQEQKTNFRYIYTLDDIPLRKDVLGVISHNSLFRVKVNGQLQTVRKFDYIFSNLMNIINNYQDRQHYIHIPLVSTPFNKEDFIRTYKGYNKSTLRYQESFQYLFITHLLGLLEQVSDSIFSKLSTDILTKVNLVLTHNDKLVIYKLSDLIELHERSSITIRLLNNINNLIAEQVSTVETVKTELVTVDTTVKSNTTAYTKPITVEEQKQAVVDLIKNIDVEAETKIEQLENVTPAQKVRLKKVAVAYKEIKIGNETIEEIITNSAVNDIEKDRLDFIKDIDDKSMLDSSIASFDKQYFQKTFKKDLVTNLINFNTQGMYLTDFKETTERSELNHLKHYNVKFQDNDGKSHTIKFTLPAVDKNGNCMLNGSLKTMKKQRINLPICKVSPTRVTLSSNYTKSMVERNTNVAHNFFSYVSNIIAKYPQKTTVSYGSLTLPKDTILPYEYTAIGKKFTTLTVDKMKFSFDYEDRFEGYHKLVVDKAKSLEEKHGVFLGKHPSTNQLYFLDLSGKLTLVNNTNNETTSSTFINELSNLLDEPLKPLNEWVEIKIQNKKIPVIFLLSYRYGLTHMLNYLNVKYTLYEPRSRVTQEPSQIKIVFKDKTLVMDRAPLVNSLLFCGLNYFNLSSFNMEDMDEKETYHEIAVDKSLNFNFVRGMDNFINLFIDPITADVLLQMKEPTNVKDLLIRATVLLTTEDHKPAASSSNFRYRSYEKMVGIVYNELSRSLVVHQGNNIGTNKFSVNPFVIKQRIFKDQLFSNVDVINPIHDIKRLCAFSHMGEGGRSADTFMIPDRQYTPDSMGIISEANIDSGNVAVNGYLSMNPNLVNTRGLTVSKDLKDIDPTELLSIASLVTPCATNDDPKRSSFISSQLSQYVPTNTSDVSRLRTGYEKVLAHRTCAPFADTAEQDGVVESIDDKLKLLKIKYKDGTKATFSYGEQFTNNGGGGFHVSQQVVQNDYKVGSKVSKGDVVTYNKEYFSPDPYSKQINWKLGCSTNVVFMEGDSTIEDSSTITQRLSDKLSFSPTHVRTVVLTHDTNIHKILSIGTEVTNIDPLLTFDNSAIPDTFNTNLDEETIALLNKLNHKTPKAKHSGTLMKIEALYNSPISEMSKSLAQVVRKAIKDNNDKSKFASDTNSNEDYMVSKEITDTDRIGLVDFSPGTVILKFYIKQNIGAGSGDKLVCGLQLKNVITKVLPNVITTEDGGVEADMIMSWLGVSNRIVNSIQLGGVTNRILEKMEDNILDMYFEN